MDILTIKLEFGSEKDENKKLENLVITQAENDIGSTMRSLFNETLTFNTIDDTVDNENATEHVEQQFDVMTQIDERKTISMEILMMPMHKMLEFNKIKYQISKSQEIE